MKDIPSYRLNFMNEVHPDELTYTYRPFAAYKDKKLKKKIEAIKPTFIRIQKDLIKIDEKKINP